jgi:hypothetical protein
MGIAAALTPRVRLMVICDKIRASKTEADVFDLKGVRQSLTTNVVPFFPRDLWLFVLLSSPRYGRFPGYVCVVNENNDKTIYFAHFNPTPVFDAGRGVMPVRMRMRCSFPEAGKYTVQIWFFQETESDVLKGEFPFEIVVEDVVQ